MASAGAFFLALFLALLFVGFGSFSSFDDNYLPVECAKAGGSMWEGRNSQNALFLDAPLNPQSVSSTGGAEIKIVDSSALLADSNPSANDANKVEANGDNIRVYVVREGDSLSQIAEMFGVSTNTIVWANDIDHGSLITPGEKLIILPITGIKYIVQSGDTIAKIAKEHSGNVEEIKSYNNISSGLLSVGQEIIIPNGEINSPSPYTKTKYAATSGASKTRNVSDKGYYMRPIRGGVISQGLHGYNAIDFATSYGAPVLAAADGEVLISRDGGRWNGGYGNYIVIKHPNGTQTLYSHNSRNSVYAGQKVFKGEVIGYIGSTGHSTGPHVHFEVRGAVNPFSR